jgi:hypothetical protein
MLRQFTLTFATSAMHPNTPVKLKLNSSSSPWRNCWNAIVLIQAMLIDKGRAIQAVSRRVHTAAVRVRARVTSCGICGGQSGTEAGFVRVLRFSLPIFIPPISPQSLSSVVWGWYNSQILAPVPSELSLTPLRIINNNVHWQLSFFTSFQFHANSTVIACSLLNTIFRLHLLCNVEQYGDLCIWKDLVSAPNFKLGTSWMRMNPNYPTGIFGNATAYNSFTEYLLNMYSHCRLCRLHIINVKKLHIEYLIWNGLHRKHRVQQFYYCCVCIPCRGKIFTESLPSNGLLFLFHYLGFQPSCHVKFKSS